MDKEFLEKMVRLDNAVDELADGQYVVPKDEATIEFDKTYSTLKIFEYFLVHGPVDFSQLTEDEKEKFKY